MFNRISTSGRFWKTRRTQKPNPSQRTVLDYVFNDASKSSRSLQRGLGVGRLKAEGAASKRSLAATRSFYVVLVA